MAGSVRTERGFSSDFLFGDLTGAIGDSVTVLPIVVAIAVVTDLSLALILVWFGVFQIVWGGYYGVPISVEPMKALAGLLLAGAVTTGEFIVGGLLAGLVLVAIGLTGTLGKVRVLFGDRVVRGVQLGVALLLLESGFGLAVSDPILATSAGAIALFVVALGYRRLSGLVVLGVGGIVAFTQVGMPSMVLPSLAPGAHLSMHSVSEDMVGATVGQLTMTIGNAAVATSLLLGDFYDRQVRPDSLSTSMGVMNLIAVPFGGVPMCHGSGGVAGKYAFGARTPNANLVLGVAYIVVAVTAVGLVAAYPLSMLGVILLIVALQLAHTSLKETTDYAFVVLVGVLSVLLNIGIAFLAAILIHLLLKRYTMPQIFNR